MSTAARPDTEAHFRSPDVVRDVVLGLSDGLTVPFALAAGLSSVTESTGIVVVAGLAEIAAGAISMGLGGYLAARSEREHYAAERRREVQETIEIPNREREEVVKVFRGYGLRDEQAAPVVAAICGDQDRWVDFMMRFELGLEQPDPTRARTSALTIGSAYIAGGLIPLGPYMALSSAKTALAISVAVTLGALAVFGYIKGRFTGTTPARSALQTMLIGGLAAAAAFLLAKAVS